MDQGRLRGAHRKLEADPIDLGNEPPFSVDGGTGGLVDRRRFSVQWFSGTILTGLCGAALMGGAVFASLDGETTFASAPERVESSLHGGLGGAGDRLSMIRKTDRLSTFAEPSVTRQILRIATTTRVRDRELIRTRPYERVSGNLSLTVSDLSANIPPFDPQKFLVGGAANDEAPVAEPDAEVSFITCDFVAGAAKGKTAPPVCDLNSLLPRVKSSTRLPLDEVISRVRDVANAARAKSPLFSTADAGAGIKLSYAAEGDNDPYLGFAPRIIPENITMLPKTTKGDDGGERIVTVKKGDTLASILHDVGATPEQINGISAVLAPYARDGGLKEGTKLNVLTAPNGLAQQQPLRVIVADDKGIEAATALSDSGNYVPVDIRNIDAVTAAPAEDDSEDDGSGVRLYQSLYETALRNHIPPAVIEEMVRIFSYDVDFQRRVEPGDSFDVLYSDDDNGDDRNDIVPYVSLTLSGESKQYYRFRTPDDGTYDYYDDTGKSAKKFLVRKPVAIGIKTSPFGWRMHPLLHIKEFHSGVDWAAPIGTPIFAAGNGTIEWIGPRGGYGKYVRIRHTDGYETAYGHMSAFARGLHVGSRVRQGQVIGFVGSTGLSTGSHVHFEIIVNDRFVDPMRVKLPRGRVLEGATLAAFERDRAQIDSALNHAPARVAQAR